ncbi:DUF2971 domain-containing protein [Methylosinus sp. Ce-a6]|uniref:DUF2971 domain-containing protein n=1 Tax=Methylosinus sp. Ce-a6 TaxID=2172005 RepID=UPI001357D990|nr:DUF2971 domain-containing protein [Methylosinus sp. Ce-a6]
MNKKIRFSDINMMNDYQEERWGYRVFELAVTNILNDELLQKKFPSLNEAFFQKVDEIIAPLQLLLYPVISCFSKDPDVLSQWRAYADDGRGFALGFNGVALNSMPVTLLEVEYDQKIQIEEMKTALLAAHIRNLESGNDFGSQFRTDCQLIGAWKVGFKNSAFREEKEVRSLHMLDVCVDGDRPRLVDAGGEALGKEVNGEQVGYRVQDGAIIAYVDIPIPHLDNAPLIQEVWVGPKNINGIGNIVYFMSECGLKDYAIHQSKASYR